MTAPQYMPLIAFPKAWTPGTAGAVKGDAIFLNVKKAADLEKYKGKLKGAIVLTQGEKDLPISFEPVAHRYTEAELKDLENAPEPGARSPYASRMEEYQARLQLQNAVNKFVKDEGAAVTLEPSQGKDGTVFVASGGSQSLNAPATLPAVVVAVEHYNRLARILQKDVPVSMEIEIDAAFTDKDTQGYNVVAEFTGTDKKLKDEIVMLGGHFDTWHSGTGATDNGAGCAIAIEALRILKAVGVQPRRTIRIALWDAEEQGLIGSREYVKNHFYDRAKKEKKPEYDKISAYFNFDNGSGKIRGVYMQGNDMMRPIFAAWLEPFRDLGVSTITNRITGGTDHLSYDAVGLPGFQFIQDPLDYSARTHHSNMDVYDRIQAGDLMQASAVIASLVYHTAVREQMLPRKPLPKPSPRSR
jgi:hypothetical protein